MGQTVDANHRTTVRGLAPTDLNASLMCRFIFEFPGTVDTYKD